ncbi:MAG: ATP-grasp domain-containing protein [Pseudobdellovibrionaceae bacterium]
MSLKKKILVIAPNTWSFQELQKRNDKYEFIFVEEQFQKEKVSVWDKIRLLWGLNFQDGVANAARLAQEHQVDGILGADDFISCLYASAAAEKLGLTGACTALELTFQHKYYSRVLQKKIVPHHVPEFGILDFENPPAYPFFVKPVRGSASMMAQRINSGEEFQKYKKIPWFRSFLYKRLLSLFEEIAQKHATLSKVKSPSVFEEVLAGVQCTLEGVVYKGQHEIIGIVDSVMYPNSKLSFERFDFPSKLPASAQEEMITVAKRLIDGAGFYFGFYNIEFFFNPETKKIKIIEVNPRMAFQFTDLYEKVLGFNTFDLFLRMTAGEAICLRDFIDQKTGKYKMATSFVKRVFQDGFVLRVPSTMEINNIVSKFPDARILLQANSGDKLSSDIFQDMESYRLMTVNLGADSDKELNENYKFIENQLRFQIEYDKSTLALFSYKLDLIKSTLTKVFSVKGES